ncbi:hypothetical protein SAMN06265339_0936 [Desulfurobacterium pacificum]|uniref:Uncharacterized protein n=1 Tax=Desulfurobacterium pacificum TaxID=240166 RepID=A0ABY1NL21_9BACT|nr:hypothetical protein [Desulfurobacterium pacificum]SMP11528.1 hypothetical protein SAMN06265339_0936 [Desulfurobacterium pacificum]
MDKIEKEVDLYRDMLKILSAYVFAIGSGIVGLLFKQKSLLVMVLLFIGFFLELMLISAMTKLYLKIRNLLQES